MRNYVIFVILLAITKLGFNQTGPGGVGSEDGSSNLEFWISANRATSTTTDGVSLSFWNDQSGNGISVSQATGTAQPTYESDASNTINNHPVIHFDGDDELQSPGSTFNITNDFSMFIVKEDNGTQPAANSGYLTVMGTSAGVRLYRDATSDKFLAKASGAIVSDFVSAAGVTNNSPFIGEYSRTGTTMFFSRFGGAYTTDAGSAGPIEFGTSPVLTVGSFNGSLYLQGNIAEQIVYSRKVNSAEKILIENYLAAKYDISLTSNDIYSQDDAGAGDYDHEVAGIGRVDASNISDNGQGTGRVNILNPTDLNDDEFLVWGHDSATLNEIVDIPGTIQSRFKRVWRVSEVNSSNVAVDVGTVDIRFDLSGLGPVTVGDLRLLIDSDNDGLFSDETPIPGATDVGSNIYEFAGITGISNDLRFTIGTSDLAQTPLPVQLSFFKTKVVDDNKKVQIDWQTVSEINNDYFTIERSVNGINWEPLQKVKGAGNSSTPLYYSQFDDSPYSGTSYYRLKQTDFDQQYSYSKTNAIQVSQEISNEILIYPNPISDHLSIEGNEEDLKHLKVYDIFGKNITASTKVISNNNKVLVLDFSYLKQGIYLIKSASGAKKVYKK